MQECLLRVHYPPSQSILVDTSILPCHQNFWEIAIDSNIVSLNFGGQGDFLRFKIENSSRNKNPGVNSPNPIH